MAADWKLLCHSTLSDPRRSMMGTVPTVGKHLGHVKRGAAAGERWRRTFANVCKAPVSAPPPKDPSSSRNAKTAGQRRRTSEHTHQGEPGPLLWVAVRAWGRVK